MSTKLKPLDLTSFAVGSSGVIDFNAFVKFNPMHLQDKAHIWLYNESGAGVDVVMVRSNNSHYLPAGAWGTFDLEPNDSQVKVTVTYLLPNAPVSLLNAIYYAPGEAVPQAFTLGNSPIGITGGVSTSSVQTLSSETAVLGTKIIDIGTLTIGDLLDIFNDHFVWKVQQAGVAHQVLAGNTAGNPLQLGQAGDISEVLGKLTVDQLLTAALGLAISASGLSVVGGTTSDTLTVTGNSLLTGVITSNNGMSIVETGVTSNIFNNASAFLQLDSPTSIQTVINGVGQFHVDANGAGLGSGSMHFLAGSIARMSIVSFTTVNGTTGTIAHGLGATPDIIIGNAFNTGVNSANITIGFSEVGATTFKASSIAVAACKALCIKT